MISIAMATYNGEKYLREQIDSILNQTIQDFELIVCDDCSTDNTWNILQGYQSQDRRIKCYRNEENLGFKKNFEKAIRLCTGEYIALSDQDDIWLPEHLEKLVNAIGSADVVCGNELLFSSVVGLEINKQKIKYVFTDFPVMQTVFLYSQLYCGNFLAGNSMMLKKNFVYTHGVLPIPNAYHDEWFIDVATFHNGFIFIEDIITKRRIHEANETGMLKKMGNISLLNKIKNLKITYRKRMENSLNILDAISERFNGIESLKRICDEIECVVRGKVSPIFSVAKYKGLVFLVRERKSFFYFSSGFILKKICVYLFL